MSVVKDVNGYDDSYMSQLYPDIRESWAHVTNNNGYHDAEVSTNIEYLESNKVNIYFNIIEGDIYKISSIKINDEINVKLKEVNVEKRKISLSYKDCQPNPIDEFVKKYPIGSVCEASIVNKKDFGLFLK